MRERFWNIVHDELEVEKLGIADNCDDALAGQIDTIVTRIRMDGWKRPRRDVEDDFRRLIRAMIDNARTKRYSELHEDTLSDGRPQAGILCPGFWPFC